MDTKFQTSFIPKKSITQGITRSRSETVSIALLIGIILFILSLAVAGGVFTYKKVLIQRIDDMNLSLSNARSSFEPESIKKWNRLNQRMEAAVKILDSHTAVTPIFGLLEQNTLVSVKFETFNYELRDNGVNALAMTGKARNFASVALQSDILGKEEAVKNPVFSDLNPDQTGAIVFKFNGIIDPTFVSYKSNLTKLDASIN